MNAVVVGDLLLDTDTIGTSERMSPEAPVPVVDVSEVRHRAGGAGLAAVLLAGRGVATELVTVLADDAPAARLRWLLHEAAAGRTATPADPAELSVVAGPSPRPTPVKARILADGRMLVRVDENAQRPDVAAATPRMLEAVRGAAVVLVSDYGRGLSAAPELRRALAEIAGSTPIVWDPHPRGAPPVTGTAIATPNLAEAARAAGVDDTTDPVRIAALLLERWPVETVAITLGGRGAICLSRGEREAHWAHPARDLPVDTCGAGDAFASALAAELVARPGRARTAPAGVVQVAVDAAGAFLAAGGAGALALPGEPVSHGPGESAGAVDLNARIARVRRAGGRIVATGGCFDLLHAGHARSLAAARAMGDMLVVLLNSDASVRRLKGPFRPLMPLADRVELLESLRCVDGVIVFEEDTPEQALDRLRPDIWAKGADYDVDRLPEAALVRGWGGRVVPLPLHPGRSTTRLAGALRDLDLLDGMVPGGGTGHDDPTIPRKVDAR